MSFDTRKATALLAHLALADRPRSRESLCDLLWPSQDPEHARGALRRTLSVLRKAVGEEWIDAASDSVALRAGAELTIDVRRFRALAGPDATPQELEQAVGIFGGELLEGFSLRDSPEFDAWYALRGRRAASASSARRSVGSCGRCSRAASMAGRSRTPSAGSPSTTCTSRPTAS